MLSFYFQLAIERLTQSSLSVEGTKSELLWLDIVWSLSVLQKVTPVHLESVLSSEFYNRLLCKCFITGAAKLKYFRIKYVDYGQCSPRKFAMAKFSNFTSI